MIRSDQYPMNIGGKGYQKEYKGYDIAVIIKQGEGIRIFIVKGKTVCWQGREKYAKIDDCFLRAKNLVDTLTVSSTLKEEYDLLKIKDKIKEKCYESAISALANAVVLCKNDQSRLRYIFDYELQKKFESI